MSEDFIIDLVRAVAGILLVCFLVISSIFALDDSQISELIEIAFILFVLWSALLHIFYKKYIPKKVKFPDKNKNVDISKRRFIYLSLIGVVSIFTLSILPNINAYSGNLLYNGNFEKGTEGWDLPEPNIFTWKIDKENTINGNPSLEVQTNETYTYSLLWSWISSRLIEVQYKAKYRITTFLKGNNVVQSSVVVQPYDENKKEMDYQLVQVPSGMNGNFPFRKFEATIEIPYGVKYIGLYLLAGLANNKGNPGKTYFSTLSVERISDLL